MVKYLLYCLLLMTISVQASVYQNNCVSCHEELPVSIDKYFYRYLLKYSSQRDVKKAIGEYLQNPTKEKTIMPEAFIDRFGIKNKTNLNKEELKNALNEYWETYKVFGKLK